MNMALPEYQELRRKLGKQLRSPQQLNSFFAADCEIVKIAAKKFITTSMDAIGEEIAIGLYQDVETWAWMTVMNSVSDLAASGSAALGISISTEWALVPRPNSSGGFSLPFIGPVSRRRFRFWAVIRVMQKIM